MAKKKTRNQQIPKSNPDNKLDQQEANTAIAPPANQQTNPETGEEVGKVTTTPDPEPTTAPVLPAEPDPVAPADTEKPKTKRIPKVNTPEEPVRGPAEDIAVGHPDDVEVKHMDIDHSTQLTPEQALGWAMTQKEPKAAINRLKRERRLLDVTGTYKALEESEAV